MKRQRRKYSRQRDLKQRDLKCFFCEHKKEPDYKESDLLVKFITGRGKILAGGRTGICHKHQRRLKIAIKRARFLALLPFTRQV